MHGYTTKICYLLFRHTMISIYQVRTTVYTQRSSRVMARSAGRVRGPSKSRGSGRVGTGGFQNLTGRVRSSGPDPTPPAKFDQTREKPWTLFSRPNSIYIPSQNSSSCTCKRVYPGILALQAMMANTLSRPSAQEPRGPQKSCA